MRKGWLLVAVIEGMVDWRIERGDRKCQLMDDVKNGKVYSDTKETVQDRGIWKKNSWNLPEGKNTNVDNVEGIFLWWKITRICCWQITYKRTEC